MIKVHETAKQKVSTLMKEEGYDPSRDYVRVGVKSGGCSGLSYELKFDSEMFMRIGMWKCILQNMETVLSQEQSLHLPLGS